MPLPLLEHIVYGPVRSRRLGASLGINLLPAGLKVCNMNCAYCQYGWTRGVARHGRLSGWPTAQAVEAAVSARLEQAADTNELIDRLTVAGHGEPTLNPEFAEIAARLAAVRNRLAPSIPIAILSNSTTAMWPEVQRALLAFDERYMKLDAGDPITYARINGPGPSISSIVDALTQITPVIVQAMFVGDADGEIDNTSDGAIAEWLAAIETIRAERVHVYTIDRQPARPSLRAVGRRRLREIAEHVRAAGIPAEVFAAGRRASA